MKIGILTERLISGYGVDLVVHEQASRLGQRGHEVSVFVLRAHQFGVSEHYDLVVVSESEPIISESSSERQIRHWLEVKEAQAFDVWIIHTWPFYSWIKHLAAPVVFVEYGTPPGHFFDQQTAYAIWKMGAKHFRIDFESLRPGDAIVSISHHVQESLPQAVQKYSSIQLLGADHYAAADPSAVAEFRERHGVEHEDFLVLWVGRMQFERDDQPYKGFTHLLNLLPAIKALSPRVKIALLGQIDGSEIHLLDEHGVIVLANHPFEEMGTAYAAANVLVNLSRWEGFNLALVEAQFQGVPVVAMNVGPHREVCRKGETGFLVDAFAEIVPAIERLLTDPKLRREMGEKAGNFARELTWDRNVGLLQKTIECCIANGTATRGLSREAILVDLPQTIALASYHELLLLDDREFVRGAFVLLLRRLPEQQAEDFFFRRLQKTDKLTVLSDISGTPEAQNATVRYERLERYRTYGKLRRRYRLWRDIRRARLSQRRK